MKGEWVMFRMKPKPGEKGEAWMLKKVTDDFAQPDEGEALVEEGLTSVASDRSMAEIAAGADVWESNKGGKKGGRTTRKVTPPPGFELPQLATLADHVPTGSGWIHELKYDGYRLLLSVGGGGALAFTRNGKDWSEQFAPLVEAAAALPAGCLLDGEAVALDANGKPNFQLMQATVKRGHGKAGPTIAYYAFDLLVDRGEDIRGLPLLERKKRLAALLTSARPPIIYGDHVEGKGEKLFDAVCKDGGEGIISKRADATYAGKRTRDWLKIKCIARQEFVIVGWQASDKRRGFRSLHLAVTEKGKLRYVGKVGTGFDTATIESLSERMAPLALDEPALDVPKTARRGSTWIKPVLVAEVAYTEFTGDGVLRHPSFLGLREDKGAKDRSEEHTSELQSH